MLEWKKLTVRRAILNELLSDLPNMNSLLEHALLSGVGKERAKRAAREVLDELRGGFLSCGNSGGKLPGLDECAGLVLGRIERETASLRRVINATGVILHTNLGRAPLGADIIAAATEACAGYCNLEFDLETGGRGDRYAHVDKLVCELTGAEASIAVNNNAAAMVLILGALAKGKKVAVSRGELVEIGGSFRIPEIIRQSGAKLVEVGTTNKTRLGDYIDAVDDKGVKALLKVHTSNYQIKGFTESVPVAALAVYGKSVGLPVIYDMGSCFLVDPGRFGFRAGETAAGGINAGADVICFSGDKLMGSAQAGIIAGRAEYIEALKKHPLARALRPDKLSLAVLEAALRLYRFPEEAVAGIPVLAMLFADREALRRRAESLAGRLEEVSEGWNVEVREVMDETGGGSLPNVALPGWAVALKLSGMSANELETALRRGKTPVIVRIQDDMVLISPRTLTLPDEDRIVEAVCDIWATMKDKRLVFYDRLQADS